MNISLVCCKLRFVIPVASDYPSKWGQSRNCVGEKRNFLMKIYHTNKNETQGTSSDHLGPRSSWISVQARVFWGSRILQVWSILCGWVIFCRIWDGKVKNDFKDTPLKIFSQALVDFFNLINFTKPHSNFISHQILPAGKISQDFGLKLEGHFRDDWRMCCES